VPYSANTPYLNTIPPEAQAKHPGDHPHPTLSETIGMAAEMFEGTITDLIPPKRRHCAGRPNERGQRS
jgi:hypothetical protein